MKIQVIQSQINKQAKFGANKKLKVYNEGKLKFGLINENDVISASFDVSTATGKEECLNSFKNLIINGKNKGRTGFVTPSRMFLL